MPGFAYLDAQVPLAFAHRGGAAQGDENTAEAFERAVALGFRYVETDVHATADGVPVVFHDDSLLRLTGEAGRIATRTWADLASIRVAGAAAIPRLDEVLAAWPEIRFNVDVKADAVVAPAVETLRRAAAFDRVLLASFKDNRLSHVRRLAGPRVATSLGRRAVTKLRLTSLLEPTSHPAPPRTGADRPGEGRDDSPGRGRRRWPFRLAGSVAAAQVPVRHGRVTVVDRRFIAAAHRRGLQVHVWTIDDPAEMRRLLDLGVDGLMTDDLEALRAVYLDRGHWPPA